MAWLVIMVPKGVNDRKANKTTRGKRYIHEYKRFDYMYVKKRTKKNNLIEKYAICFLLYLFFFVSSLLSRKWKNGLLCCLKKKYRKKKRKINKNRCTKNRSHFLQACIQIWPNHWVAGESARGGEKIKT